MRKVILSPPKRSIKQIVQSMISSGSSHPLYKTVFKPVERKTIFSGSTPSAMIMLSGLLRQEQKFTPQQVKNFFKNGISTLWVEMKDQIAWSVDLDRFEKLENLSVLSPEQKKTMQLKIVTFDYSIHYLPSFLNRFMQNARRAGTHETS